MWMIGSIPAETSEQKERVARLQRMETAKIAPLAVYLASDQAKEVSGQIFAVRPDGRGDVTSTHVVAASGLFITCA